MSRKVTLFVIPGMKSNQLALETVGRLPDTRVEEVPCPVLMKEWFDLPFVRDEDGVSYYGMEGITSFAERIAENVDVGTTKVRNGLNGVHANGKH